MPFDATDEAQAAALLGPGWDAEWRPPGEKKKVPVAAREKAKAPVVSPMDARGALAGLLPPVEGSGWENPGAMLGPQSRPLPAGLPGTPGPGSPTEAAAFLEAHGNPGAMLPGLAGSAPPPPGMGALLAQQMMRQQSAQDYQRQFQDFMRQGGAGPRSVTATPQYINGMPIGIPQFTPESDASYHDRSLNAFAGLDRMASGNEKLALEKYLGVGELGNKTTQTGLNAGNLEIAQRAQQEQERQGAYGRDKNTEAMKLFQAMKMGGATDKDALRAAGMLSGLGAPTGMRPAGFGINPGNPLRPINLPPGTPGTPGAGERTEPQRPPGLIPGANAVKKLTEFETALGLPAHGAAEQKGTLPEAAVALHSVLGDQEFAEKLPVIKQYLTGRFGGRNWEGFVHPNAAQQLGRRLSNVFTRPSNEEMLMSMIRAQQGLAPAYGATGLGPRPSWVPSNVLGLEIK